MKAIFSGAALVAYALPIEPGQWFLAVQVHGDLSALAKIAKDGQPVQLTVNPAPVDPPSRPRAKSLAMAAGILCRDRTFVRWMSTTFPARWKTLTADNDSERAAQVLRSVCGVASRADLDSDDRAAGEFHRLIRKPYADWLTTNAKTLEETP